MSFREPYTPEAQMQRTLTAIWPQSGVSPCLSLHAHSTPDKSAVLSLPVPHCISLSVKENDYESEGRRFESCWRVTEKELVCRLNVRLRKRAGNHS